MPGREWSVCAEGWAEFREQPVPEGRRMGDFSGKVELEPVLKDGEERDKRVGPRELFLAHDPHESISPLRTGLLFAFSSVLGTD